MDGPIHQMSLSTPSLPEVLHGDDPLGQELHQDARARPLLLLVGHGAVLDEPGVEKHIARVP